jgi:hypothetical protein
MTNELRDRRTNGSDDVHTAPGATRSIVRLSFRRMVSTAT